MPRGPKRLIAELHSSEVDELADDAPAIVSPSRSGRPGPPGRAVAAQVTGFRLVDAKYGKKASDEPDAEADASSPSTASRLEAFRCQSRLASSTSTLYELLANQRARPAGSRRKRSRSPKQPGRGKLASAPSSAKRRRRNRVDEPTQATVDQDSRLADDFLFVMPELDEDGEPVYESSVQVESSPRSTSVSRAGPATLPLGKPAASSRSARSPFQPAPAHRASSSSYSAAYPYSPAQHPPSSIDLPYALASRIYAERSPSVMTPSASLTADAMGLATKEAAPDSDPHPSKGTSTTVSSQRLTSEQQLEVNALLAELEIEAIAEEGLGPEAFESSLETTNEAPLARCVGEAYGTAELACKEEAGETLSSPASNAHDSAKQLPLPKSVIAPLPVAASHSPRPKTAVPAISTPDCPSSAIPSAWGNEEASVDYRFCRVTTPPRRSPAYRLVPLSAEGLAAHAREVIAATMHSDAASAAEVVSLRGEVERLVRELEQRDALLGEKDEEIRRGRENEAAWVRRQSEWEAEFQALEQKFDVLREIRKGLLRDLKEERAKVDMLKQKIAGLDGKAPNPTIDDADSSGCR